jgi:hypothetical protein
MKAAGDLRPAPARAVAALLHADPRGESTLREACPAPQSGEGSLNPG